MENSKMDIVLHGGRIICPTSRIDGVADVGVKNGKIAAIGGDLSSSAAKTIDVSGKLVLPGLLDPHGISSSM